MDARQGAGRAEQAGNAAMSEAALEAPIPARPAWAAAIPAALAAQWDRLVLWLPVAMGCGIILYFALPEEPPAFLAAPALMPLPAALWLRRRERPLAAWAMALLGMAGLGFAACLAATARQAPMPALPARAMLVTGRVEAVELLPEGRRLTLGEVRAVPSPSAASPRAGEAAEGEPLRLGERSLRLRLRANDPAAPEPGDTVSLRALLRPPPAPAYPGGWDFQRNAFFAGQAGSGFAIGPASVVRGQDERPFFAGLRAAIEARVMGAIGGAAGAVSAALLTGGVSAIPPADLAAMRDSGLAHLLSVSGLHIAVVMGVVFALARFLVALVPAIALRWDSKALAMLLGLAAGGGYMLLTGSQVPMVRSFAMAALVALGVVLGRRALSLRALALAAFLIMLVRPEAMLGPSFQMSFAAVLALVAGWEALRPAMQGLRGQGQWWRAGLAALAGLVLTSLLAGLATTPYGLHHFGRLQLYGVAANAIAVPLTSVLVMPAGMLALLLMPLGLEGLPLRVMAWGVEGVLMTARWVAAWPGAALVAPPIPAWGLALTSLGLLWLCLWRARWRLWGLALIAAGLASGLGLRAPDLLVSADARLIALRTDQGVFVQRASGGSAFVRENWLRSWGEEGAAEMPRGAGEAAGGLIACDATLCRLRAREGEPAVLLLRGEGRRDAPRPVVPIEACAGVALVLSAEPVRGRCPGVPVIDRFTVWREGAQAVRLGPGGAAILSDRAARGERPWVPPPPRPAGPASGPSSGP